MYKIPANTLFLGKSLVYVPQCHSTNTLASELSQKEDTPEGLVVITDDQTAGKGQRGSTWVAAAGQNLTISVILRPRFIPVMAQFQINRAVSLAVADYVQEKITEEKVAIKWPNDILIGLKKTAGILIENHINGTTIGASIVGMGVNVNQETFPWPKATSLRAATGKKYELNHELGLLLGHLEARYLELKNGKQTQLEKNYLAMLYKLNERHRFISGDAEWEGTITGVDETGRLKVMTDDGERTFGVKEIGFL